MRTAVIMTFDGLGARSLGAYGNASIPTPHFDRFAADGLLFETAMASARADQTPLDMNPRRQRRTGESDWLAAAAQQGGTTCLVTDDRSLLSAQAERFSIVNEVDFQRADRPAADIGDTHLARFFAQAWEIAESLRPGSLMWLHSSSLEHLWDAPLELRELMTAEGEAVPSHDVAPPTAVCDARDEDALWRHRANHAAQIMVLDACLGAFVEQLEQRYAMDRGLITLLAGTRGFPLGEHGQLGESRACPYHEALHVPLFLRPGLPDSYGIRLGHLVDLATGLALVEAYVEDRYDVEILGLGAVPRKQREIWAGQRGSARLVRTHGWFFLERQGDCQLFLKPDDRWDQNDVQRRCPHVIEGFQKWLAENAVEIEGAVPLDDNLPLDLVQYS